MTNFSKKEEAKICECRLKVGVQDAGYFLRVKIVSSRSCEQQKPGMR